MLPSLLSWTNTISITKRATTANWAKVYFEPLQNHQVLILNQFPLATANPKFTPITHTFHLHLAYLLDAVESTLPECSWVELRSVELPVIDKFEDRDGKNYPLGHGHGRWEGSESTVRFTPGSLSLYFDFGFLSNLSETISQLLILDSGVGVSGFGFRRGVWPNWATQSNIWEEGQIEEWWTKVVEHYL